MSPVYLYMYGTRGGSGYGITLSEEHVKLRLLIYYDIVHFEVNNNDNTNAIIPKLPSSKKYQNE